MNHELHFRTGLRVLAAAAFLGIGLAALRGRPVAEWLARLEKSAEARYPAWLAGLLGVFFLASCVAKFSQLHALELHGQDFWLFEDMLAQMMHGGFLITRYAPQAIGWVQHGAVHPMLSWALALPIAWITGPTAAALLFGPLVLTAAAGVLSAIARPRWGAPGALAAAMAFLASSQVARVLMYEVHPEAAYPLFVFLWGWSAGWGDGKTRPAALLLSTALSMGVKEDSFAVLFPLMAAAALFRRELPRKWIALSAALAAGVSLFQFHAVAQWSNGAWGPHQWQGAEVILPKAAAPLGARHWDGPSSALAIARDIVEAHGGLAAVLKGWIRFLFSRPWLGLLLAAPWVALQPAFWISALPLAAVYSLLGDPGKFINYYSAPVLGAFWLAAVNTRRARLWPWTLTISLFLGGSGLVWYLPAPTTAQTAQEARELIACLPQAGQGAVSSRFIGLVPREKIFSDRTPPSGDPRSSDARFYLLSRQLPSYEIPSTAADPLIQRLKEDPRWVRVGKNCQPLRSDEDNPAVLLFIERQGLLSP